MSKQKKAPKVRKPWTPEEDAKLLMGISTVKLAKELKRTATSVQSRKNVLKNSPPTSPYTPPPNLKPEVKMAAKVVVPTENMVSAAHEAEKMLQEVLNEEETMDRFIAISVNNRTMFIEREGLEAINIEDGAVSVMFKD